MDESFDELEAELKSLHLRRPAPALLERIGSELAVAAPSAAGPRYTSATNLNSWKWLGWRAAGLAAAFALITTVSWLNLERKAPVVTRTPEQIAATSPARPTSDTAMPAKERRPSVAATNVLYDLKDEGTVYVNGDTPARRLRYRYLDTYTWKNPRNNASLKWSVPRDEIRVLPASLN
jgi:hypothetical protein